MIRIYNRLFLSYHQPVESLSFTEVFVVLVLSQRVANTTFCLNIPTKKNKNNLLIKKQITPSLTSNQIKKVSFCETLV